MNKSAKRVAQRYIESSYSDVLKGNKKRAFEIFKFLISNINNEYEFWLKSQIEKQNLEDLFGEDYEYDMDHTPYEFFEYEKFIDWEPNKVKQINEDIFSFWSKSYGIEITIIFDPSSLTSKIRGKAPGFKVAFGKGPKQVNFLRNFEKLEDINKDWAWNLLSKKLIASDLRKLSEEISEYTKEFIESN